MTTQRRPSWKDLLTRRLSINLLHCVQVLIAERKNNLQLNCRKMLFWGGGKAAIVVQKMNDLQALLQLIALSPSDYFFQSALQVDFFFSAIGICNSDVNRPLNNRWRLSKDPSCNSSIISMHCTRHCTIPDINNHPIQLDKHMGHNRSIIKNIKYPSCRIISTDFVMFLRSLNLFILTGMPVEKSSDGPGEMIRPGGSCPNILEICFLP